MLISTRFTCSAAFVLLSLATAGAAQAGTIPYPNVGTEAPVFTAVAAGGEVDAYYYSGSSAYTDSLGLVGGLPSANGVLNNATSVQGDKVDFGTFAKGTVLDFYINVSNTGETYYVDASKNDDGYNHAYGTSYTAKAGVPIPSGLFIGFEDLSKNVTDADYNDISFVFSGTTVPLPASLPMFGAAILALGAIGYGARRKGSATA